MKRDSEQNHRHRRPGIGILWYELRLGLRALLRKPIFTITVIATLGLAIGANTTVFSIFYGVLLKPLPYPEPDRLVGLYRVIPSLMGENPSNARVSGWYAVPYATYLDWAKGSAVFEECGAYAPTALTIVTGEEPRRVPAARTTSGVFSALGISPLIGRPLTQDDDEAGQPARVLLSYGFWQRQFGGDPEVLGRPLVANDTSYEISGVMPQEFAFPGRSTELWITFDDQRKSSSFRKGGYLQVIARFKPGVPIAQAQIHMEEVYSRIKADHPDETEFGIRLIERLEIVGAQIRPGLLLLLCAVGTVLLIACTNIANLTLVRMTERRREIGLRQALGEGRGRLMIHLWSECLLLSICGGAVGAVLAAVSLRTVIAAFPTPLPRAHEITLDSVALLFILGISLAVGLFIGILPAIRWLRISVVESLAEISRAYSGSKRRNRAHALMVASEIALAFMLLASAGLFIRSLSNLMAVDPGFVAENVLITRITMPDSSPTPEKIEAFYRDITDRLESVPGVSSVGRASQMPFAGGLSYPPVTIDTPTGELDGAIHTAGISPRFFQSMGIPLISGRIFTQDDRQGTPPVAIVNQSLARQYWPGENPLGRRLRINNGDEPPWLEVVGVAKDFLYGLQEPPFPAIYYPMASSPWVSQALVIKSAIPAARIVAPVRQVFRDVDRSMPVTVSVLEDRIDQSDALIMGRFAMIVFGILAVAAGFLAILGIYGVLAYTVTQRTREFGIRLAIGADKGSVLRAVLVRGLIMAGVGLGVGLLGSVAAARVLRSMLFGVHPNDPLTLTAVAIVIVAAAALAGYLPARRATKVDPISILRCE